MKHFLVSLIILIFTTSAFAQRRYPRHPYPRPHASCQVVAVDRYHRVIARYTSRGNNRSWNCSKEMRRCMDDVRRRGWWDVRCMQVRGW